jgi:hypothetical protein
MRQAFAQRILVTSITMIRPAQKPCRNAFHEAVDTPVDQDNILEVQQNSKNWYRSLALDPVQTTTSPSWNTFHKAVDAPVDRTTGPTGRRKGKWTAEEDDKLLRAAEKFAVTRWKAIAALIPGRTKKQCWNRWQYALHPSTVRTTEHTGKWLTEEDDNLAGAVENTMARTGMKLLC